MTITLLLKELITLLKRGQNIILLNKITKINIYQYINIKKKKIRGAIAPLSEFIDLSLTSILDRPAPYY